MYHIITVLFFVLWIAVISPAQASNNSIELGELFNQDGQQDGEEYQSFHGWDNVLNTYSYEIILDIEQITMINSLINQVEYVSDMDNWGQEDYWAQPNEFFAKGGDCEDYVIAKYFSLLALGLEPDDMSVLILFKKQTQEYHVVLQITHDDNMYILDNEYDQLLEASHLDKFEVLYNLSNEILEQQPDS